MAKMYPKGVIPLRKKTKHKLRKFISKFILFSVVLINLGFLYYFLTNI